MFGLTSLVLGATTPVGAGSEETKRSVPKYDQVSAEARKALDPYVSGAQIIDIQIKEAHGVVATTVIYVRQGKIHEIAYNESTHKIAAGDEPAVIEKVISVLPESAQRIVREGGQTLYKIKVKHDEKDDHEYIHVHYLADDGEILNRKLELDGSDKNQGETPSQETERVISEYSQVSAEARKAFDPHVAGAQICGIVQAAAHGVVETAVTYLRDGKVHEIVYDETTAKLLGGSEPGAIEQVISVLPESGQSAVRKKGQTIYKIKIKHDERDDREYVHVNYVDDNGMLTNSKLELDGHKKGKQAAA
ncbi:MAG: hypothetical protein WD425_17250 [Nitrospirales bacterium]